MKIWMCERRFRVGDDLTVPIRFVVDAKTKKAAEKKAWDMSLAAFRVMSPEYPREIIPETDPVVLYPM